VDDVDIKRINFDGGCRSKLSSGKISKQKHRLPVEANHLRVLCACSLVRCEEHARADITFDVFECYFNLERFIEEDIVHARAVVVRRFLEIRFTDDLPRTFNRSPNRRPVRAVLVRIEPVKKINGRRNLPERGAIKERKEN